MAQTAVRMTALAQLIDVQVMSELGMSLPTYLALKRAPGLGWKTYDEIAADLSAIADRPLNRVSLKSFAEDTFGIPDTRYATVDGRNVNMPRAVGMDIVEQYLRDLSPETIDVALVRAQASGELGRALDNSAAGNVTDLGDFTQYADDSDAQ